jgi:chromosome segregation ATPase
MEIEVPASSEENMDGICCRATGRFQQRPIFAVKLYLIASSLLLFVSVLYSQQKDSIDELTELVKKRLTKIESAINVLSKRITELQEGFTTLEQATLQLKTQVKGISSDTYKVLLSTTYILRQEMDSLWSEVKLLQGAIQELSRENKLQEQQMASLEDALSAMKDKSQKNKNIEGVEDLYKKAKSFEDNIEEISKTIAIMKNKIEQIESQLIEEKQKSSQRSIKYYFTDPNLKSTYALVISLILFIVIMLK